MAAVFVSRRSAKRRPPRQIYRELRLIDTFTVVLLIANTFVAHCLDASTLSLPQDFGTTQGIDGVYYQAIGDSRASNTQNPAPAGTLPMTFEGSVGSPPSNFPDFDIPSGGYPFVQLDAADKDVLMHPEANQGSSIEYVAPTAGTYVSAGAFARDNPNIGAGDGVDVLVIKNLNLNNPLFFAHISANNLVDTTHPFAGTGVAPFTVSASLQAGDSLRFIVFSGPQGLDASYDGTAFYVNIGQVPEPSSLALAALGGIALVSWWTRRSWHR
jgi:hypothetical protein